MIKLIRSDDRMIHGQCIVRVLADFSITRIIAIDDFTATNAMLKRIFELAMPPQIKGGIYTVDEAIAQATNQVTGPDNTLILLKSPLTAKRLFEEVAGLPPAFNIGPLSNRPETQKATRYAYLNIEEYQTIEQLAERGVRVYFNQVIDQPTTEWVEICKNIKF